MKPRIPLSDPKNARLDSSGKSPAYFTREDLTAVDFQLVRDLEAISRANGGKPVRFCLHKDAQAAFHNMVVLAPRQVYNRPHLHPGKDESYQAIEGSAVIVIFDAQGAIVDHTELSAKGCFLYRVAARQYHMVVPLTDPFVYNESRPGPFMGAEEATQAAWSPDGSDAEKARAFVADILKKTHSK